MFVVSTYFLKLFIYGKPHLPFSFDDIRCLSQCNVLSELSLDGNPFSLEQSYKHCVLKNIPSLRQFDMRRVTVTCLVHMWNLINSSVYFDFA
jgi:hypothetical protein